MKINEIINSDCLLGLQGLPDQSVNCCVTSPPYFGLRDYGVEGQLGLEETPEAFIAGMVAVFREVKRVLKNDGTLWLNIGDSYANTGNLTAHRGQRKDRDQSAMGFDRSHIKFPGVKQKDLIGIPWMLAFALRADGWYLRQDIVWHKPNQMPESVTDRCTKSHEYIFLLSKSAKYYYDYEAIKTEMLETSIQRNQSGWVQGKQNHFSKYLGSDKAKEQTTANKRSVWTVTTKPFSEAHFATFPEDLIVDCIKAGCPEDGIVLDPFMGAGTTALVARKLNRNYTGFELNPAYIEIANRRLRNELGMFL